MVEIDLSKQQALDAVLTQLQYHKFILPET